MPRRMCHRRLWKALLLCLAVAALAVITTAAALPAHWHSAIGGVSCEICCIAHAPVLHSPVIADVRPPVPVERHIAVERLAGPLESFFFADLGRAPPAWLLARG